MFITYTDVYNKSAGDWIHRQFFLSFYTKDFSPKNIKNKDAILFPCNDRKLPANKLRKICVKSKKPKSN